MTGQGVRLTGCFVASQLPRLASAVAALPEPVEVSLDFATDEQNQRVVTGRVSANVTVNCQRCMQPMEQQLQAEVALGLVWSEEDAPRLNRDLEPWVVADDSASLSDMVEDELLLALPYVNYHPLGECSASSHYSTGEVEVEEKPNPFQVLEQLKKKL
ncbi:YceD family protein [Porticoccus sp. GXU_MW_L64]